MGAAIRLTILSRKELQGKTSESEFLGRLKEKPKRVKVEKIGTYSSEIWPSIFRMILARPD